MNSDDVGVGYLSKREYVYRCEDCGYKWSVNIEEEEENEGESNVERSATSPEELFGDIEISECPMCGNNNIVEV